MNGKVKFFKEDKGFGFILGDDGKDYFVHVSDVDNNEILKTNDSVTFNTEKTDRGTKATKVVIL